MLSDPEDYAPFPYRRDRLTFMRMDGRRLAFDDGYVRHRLFAVVDRALRRRRECRRDAARNGPRAPPGGILALATEYVLEGPPHEETFQPAEFMPLIDQPGLELVEPIDTGVYQRYAFKPVDLYGDPFETPHMVVRFDDTVFTTVMVFLRKVS